MTQLNITLNLDDLKDKVESSSLESPVKAALTILLNSMMEKERDEYINALSHERTEERRGYRNGYYERELISGAGSLRLKVPRTRDGEFSTTVFQRYKRCEQALIVSMMEMVVNGVSTRKVTKIVEELCGKSVSKSLVSDLMKSLDPVVQEWKDRPLHVFYYPYIYVDAMYIKVREHHKVVSKAVHIACGVNQKGDREIIGLQITHGESEESWVTFFDYLKSRGLSSPKMVISDAHTGLVSAIKKKFVGTSWQRCCVHLLRNMIEVMPKKGTEKARQELRAIFKATDLPSARQLKNQFMTKYEDQKGFSKVIQKLDDGFDDATQFYAHDFKHYVHLRTTNVIERANEELRRREKVIRIFPHDQSAIRILGSVLMDMEERWKKQNRPYLGGLETTSNE
ncbi:IS256 family transposase [Bacillus piscicola]|uniref:IS256 family transposase n=1 Tax=Bacillus piscicola TaxID=1632684 RepID=UPI001F08B768|nr:IS256 family transposase [Bacillus piscicola]